MHHIDKLSSSSPRAGWTKSKPILDTKEKNWDAKRGFVNKYANLSCEGRLDW